MSRLRPNKQIKRRAARSEAYQYLICEIPFGDDVLNSFDYHQSYQGRLDQAQVSDDILQLQDELIQLVWTVIDTQCTKRQKEVLNLYFVQGMTQTETAKELGINQSSVVKSLWGNADYRGEKVKRYGGIFKKLKKILSINPKALELMEKIKELQN